MARQLKDAGASDAVASGAASLLANLAASGVGAVAGGGSTTAVAGAVNVDANNRQLHFDEKQLIAKKANGDKKVEERLTKAACYEVKCWAQFPEGSPLYTQYYVSAAEAAGLAPELAWVKEQQASGTFIYSPFQKMTDKVAATTGISSVAGRGTFNGEFISKPSQSPFMENYCVTAECAAFMEPFRGHTPPDYVTGQLSFYVVSGALAVNLHNGDVFGGVGFGRSYPYYSTKPGISVSIGSIFGDKSAQATSNFLGGGGAQASGFAPLPFAPWLGVGAGLSHSYGGATAVEGGLSIPFGYAVSPAAYSTEFKKVDKK